MAHEQVTTTTEMAGTLKAAFDQFFPAPIDAWMEFAERCTVVNYPKDHILKAAHSTERYMHFIVSGSAGVFLWKENNPVCLDLGFENHFFADYMSLLLGQPTPLETMTLEASILLRLSREDYLKLGETPVGMVLTRAAGERSYIAKQQQQIDLLTKTAEDRYREMLQMHPEIIRRVAQKHLASYLGITPQSISRIRRSLR